MKLGEVYKIAGSDYVVTRAIDTFYGRNRENKEYNFVLCLIDFVNKKQPYNGHSLGMNPFWAEAKTLEELLERATKNNTITYVRQIDYRSLATKFTLGDRIKINTSYVLIELPKDMNLDSIYENANVGFINEGVLDNTDKVSSVQPGDFWSFHAVKNPQDIERGEILLSHVSHGWISVCRKVEDTQKKSIEVTKPDICVLCKANPSRQCACTDSLYKKPRVPKEPEIFTRRGWDNVTDVSGKTRYLYNGGPRWIWPAAVSELWICTGGDGPTLRSEKGESLEEFMIRVEQCLNQ